MTDARGAGGATVERAFERLASVPFVPELAMLASGTGRVNRVVLRALRLLVPEADATTESDLWFSELVARHTANEVVLRTEALDRLRARLAASPRLDAALTTIERVHATAPPLLRLEDELIRLALRSAPSAELEARLGRAFETLQQRAERSLDIAIWALHALPRLPSAVRDTAAAWSLALAAEARAGYSVSLGTTPPPGVRLVDPPNRPLPRTPVGVSRRGRTVVLGEVDGPTLDVPATTPRVLRLEAGDWSQLVAIPAKGTCEPIELPDGELVVTDLTGRRWKIENQHRPSPMT